MDRKELISLARECVLCGRCKAKCPTYQLLLNESFGPRGRMHLAEAFLKGDLSTSDALKQRLLSCTLCGACERTCPKSAPVPWVMASLRQALIRKPLTKAIAKWTFRHSRTAYRLGRLLYPALREKLARRGLIPPRGPLFEYTPLDWGDVFTPEKSFQTKGRIVLFSGCAVRFVFPYIAEAFIRVCTASGYEVVLPKSEFCCGAPLLSMGLKKEAQRLAKKNLQYLGALKADLTVSLCPTCVNTMKNIYPELAGSAFEVEDSTSFLRDCLSELPVKKQRAMLVYHHPCHALYGLDIKRDPIDILTQMGITVTELPEGCCGFAGSFSLRFPELSRALLEGRFRGMNRDSVTLVTACPGCIFQFMKALPEARVMHILEVLEEAIDEP